MTTQAQQSQANQGSGRTTYMSSTSPTQDVCKDKHISFVISTQEAVTRPLYLTTEQIVPQSSRYRFAYESHKDYTPTQDADLVILDLLEDMMLQHMGPNGSILTKEQIHQVSMDLLKLCRGSRRLSLLTPVIMAVVRGCVGDFFVQRSFWFRRRESIIQRRSCTYCKHLSPNPTISQTSKDDEKQESSSDESSIDLHIDHPPKNIKTPKVSTRRCTSIPLPTRVVVHQWKKTCSLDEKESITERAHRRWEYLKIKWKHH